MNSKETTEPLGVMFLMERGMYRNRALLDVAHTAPCMWKIPEVCEDGRNPSVPCHSNELRHGRGKDLKSHDVYAPAGCPRCHYWYDFGPAPRQEKQDALRVAIDRWMLWLFRSGRVRVL